MLQPGRSAVHDDGVRWHRHDATVEHLCATQKPDGDWYEEEYTGTGFPLDFMIRYHLYRITFPVLALGRLRERLTR